MKPPLGLHNYPLCTRTLEDGAFDAVCQLEVSTMKESTLPVLESENDGSGQQKTRRNYDNIAKCLMSITENNKGEKVEN